MSLSSSPTTAGRRRARRVGLVVALWVFSVATTVLLIGVWGRAVAYDDATLQASTRAVIESDVVADRITGWIADGIAAASALAPPQVESAVAGIRALPETTTAIDVLVDQAVSAALAAPGTEPEIDVATALVPLAPAITDRLQTSGIDVSLSEIEAGLAGIAVIALDTQQTSGFAGVAVQAQSALTRVVLGAGAVMLLAGATVIALAEERTRMVRSLLTRVMVSALTFGIVLRLGAWAVDPGRGRSPVAAGGSVVLRSNLWVLVAVATGTGVAATIGWMTGRRRLHRLRTA